MLSLPALNRFIEAALAEDAGAGDHSTLACIPAEARGRAVLKIKEDGVLAGMAVAEAIFRFLEPDLHFRPAMQDGDSMSAGQEAFEVRGHVHTLLLAERLVLNCMQRMSGIATATRRLVEEIADTGVAIVDTRKTTPNFRLPEKWAVRIGGGQNHRLGLFDMIMLKDNHVQLAGGVREAILLAKDYIRATGKELKVEIEVSSVEQAKEAIETGGVDVIMLDNMSPEEMQEAVKYIAKRCITEASGGITLETIRAVATTGVDLISVGALTHSIKSLDLSLKIRSVNNHNLP